MGFDFVNTRISGVTGPVTVISGSVSYTGLNANLILGGMSSSLSGSGSITVRNGLIIATSFTSSTQPF
jgi:hypothetical protein